MQRRDGSADPVKGGGRKAATPRARKAPVTQVPTADLQKQVTALTRELKEAREQQTATADVLRVISSSATDLQSVFESIASNAVILCGATYSVVYRFDGELISMVAH